MYSRKRSRTLGFSSVSVFPDNTHFFGGGTMKSLSTTNAGSIGLYLRRGDVRLGLLLAVVMLLFAAQGLAQEATFVGTVMDPSGAAVANAKVTLTNLDTNATKVLNTNDSGQFTAVDIHIGHYNIQVEMNGFKTAEKKGLVLQVGDRMRVDFQLQVGGSAETVAWKRTRSLSSPILAKSVTSSTARRLRDSRSMAAAFINWPLWPRERPARSMSLLPTPRSAAVPASNSTAFVRITISTCWMAAKTMTAVAPAA